VASLRRAGGRRGDAVDAEGVAAEVVMRAWCHFGHAPACWQHVRRWCFVVASHRRVDRLRRMRFVSVDDAVRIDEVPMPMGPAASAPSPELPVPLWASMLREVLREPDRATFDHLLAGVHDNAVIAQLRGRSVRAVEMSRRRIAEAADGLRAAIERSQGTGARRLQNARIRSDRFAPDR
jgi:DNA-directed RNA polymerase specialized sigma24 family protein